MKKFIHLIDDLNSCHVLGNEAGDWKIEKAEGFGVILSLNLLT